MPTDGFVQLPPNSSGERIHTFVVGSDNYEGVVLVDPNDGTPIGVATLNGKKLLAVHQKPSSPKSSALSALLVAAGMSTDLDGATITLGQTGKLVSITVAASVPLKAEIKTVNGVTVATRDVIFTTDASLTYTWYPPHKDWFTASTRFRVTLTNQDTVDAADVYTTIYWDEES